jgi:3-dehydroquinate synthase
MAREVKIDLDNRSYFIWIGTGVLDRLAEVVRGLRGIVVTDVNVAAAHGAAAMAILGSGWEQVVLPPGEATKSSTHWSDLLEKMAVLRLDRQAVVVALGGGVVGDLAGFAAATYMRGIRFVQVPTSLLAMVDSSVGGKTGINLAAGKNLAGAFYQPLAVVADLATLATLPEREFAAGLAEIVKYAVALDAPFMGWLEDHTAAIHARESQALEQMVARCCEIKADVVSQDEREGGLRALLNFGHTLGHALEKITGYASLLHGEGVALGMVYALELAVARCGFPQEDAQRVTALLRAFDLPVAPARGWTWEAVREAMAVDKKSAGGQVRFVLSRQLGQSDLPVVVPEAELEAAWKRWCAHVISQ